MSGAFNWVGEEGEIHEKEIKRRNNMVEQPNKKAKTAKNVLSVLSLQTITYQRKNHYRRRLICDKLLHKLLQTTLQRVTHL